MDDWREFLGQCEPKPDQGLDTVRSLTWADLSFNKYSEWDGDHVRIEELTDTNKNEDIRRSGV